MKRWKVHFETKKIMGDDSIDLGFSNTAVRVPVAGGHSEAVFVELEKEFTLGEVRDALSAFPGVVVEDDPQKMFTPCRLILKVEMRYLGELEGIFLTPWDFTFGL